MGAKEALQKELDLLLEKLRFWRYTLLAILSGAIGIFYYASIDTKAIVFLFLALLAIFTAIHRINKLTKKYYNLLDQLKDTE